MVPPIREHLEALQAKARIRLEDGGQKAFIDKQCKKIAAKLRRRPSATAETPGMRKAQWAAQFTKNIMGAPRPNQTPPWVEEQTTRVLFEVAQKQKIAAATRHFADEWRKQWEKYQSAHNYNRDPTAAQTGRLEKKAKLQLHEKLTRAESSLAIQIRIEKIGFAYFLHRRRVPSVTSPACECGHESQTAKHVIRHCPLRSRRDRDQMSAAASTKDYRKLISTSKGLKSVVPWLMKQGLLAQFTIAAEQLDQ